MKDIEAFKTAEREKKVAITMAEKEGEESLIKQIKLAEAEKEVTKGGRDQYRSPAKKEAAIKEGGKKDHC